MPGSFAIRLLLREKKYWIVRVDQRLEASKRERKIRKLQISPVRGS